MGRLAVLLALMLALGCASNLSIVKRYDTDTGKLACSSRVSSRILGTGETEMMQENPCGGDVTYSTRETGISDNAKELGVLGIRAARPGGLLEGAAADLLESND